MKIVKKSPAPFQYTFFLVGAFVFFLILAYVVNISSQYSLQLSENGEQPLGDFINRMTEPQWGVYQNDGKGITVAYQEQVTTIDEKEQSVQFVQDTANVFSYTRYPAERVQDVMRKEENLVEVTGVSRYGWEGFSARRSNAQQSSNCDERCSWVLFLQKGEDTIRIEYTGEIGKAMAVSFSMKESEWTTKTYPEYGVQFDVPNTWFITEEAPNALTIFSVDPQELDMTLETERLQFQSVKKTVASMRFSMSTLLLPEEIQTDLEYLQEVILADEEGVTKRLYQKDGRIAQLDTTEVKYSGAKYPLFMVGFYTFPHQHQLFSITVKAERYPSSDFFYTEQGRVARRVLDSVRIIN